MKCLKPVKCRAFNFSLGIQTKNCTFLGECLP